MYRIVVATEGLAARHFILSLHALLTHCRIAYNPTGQELVSLANYWNGEDI